jgi:hypothetical protein
MSSNKNKKSYGEAHAILCHHSENKMKLIKKNNLNFKGLSNESLFKIIQIKNNNDVSKLNFLFEGDNSKALTKAITFHPIKYQFSALDMNHETYKLMAKIVSPEIKVINLD